MSEPPRLIGRKEAAAYLGIAESTFSMWVATHKMPPTIPGTRKWDKRAIDTKLDEISGLTTLHDTNVFGELDELEEWREQQKQRDKHRPLYGLDARKKDILRFLFDYPHVDSVDQIPRAGETTMAQLSEIGLVRTAGRDHRGRPKWSITEEGRNEIRRIDTWTNWSSK
ncbi:UNVERIFIED_ORG: hypothetical protein QE446_003834 [Rhizobium sp. SORGH_AS260]|uniref:helix-turn-helix transcriptional regulator n=1 Tax=Agrobacterium sp. SORGH_AS_0440 TaxID=3041757 RepID=UPI002784EF4E|nr:hypothetical protein [Agrobacterium sp. SORGH_AS_0440]MDP9732209.1 hypothetical protein [Rhizobium sp. SORGH_AS_0285]MDP9755958.1 hypothetical protein [Rhizobium sp. SORGH_AS_0260]MDR6081381.1 hypothetical protein [Agrobacterium sp. SORGH_AS_0440]